MPNHEKKFEWGSADSSGRNVRKGAWQWYDGGKRKGPLSVAERVTQLRKTRSKRDLAIEKAVEAARRLQKAAVGRKVPKVGHAIVFQPGQDVWFASVHNRCCGFKGRSSGCGSLPDLLPTTQVFGLLNGTGGTSKRIGAAENTWLFFRRTLSHYELARFQQLFCSCRGGLGN